MKTSLTFRFVEFIPRALEEGILYITVEYKAAVHLCACGCGSKVITPITPNHWKMIYDGKTVSLSPSIGNWSFECQSHYWIRKNEIIEAPNSNHASIREKPKKEVKKKWAYFKKRRKK